MRGLFFAMEGGDATGKTTQCRLLLDRMRREGHEVRYLDFPQYERAFGALIGKILRGELCPGEKVHGPFVAGYMAALFGADRWTIKPELERGLTLGVHFLTNRFERTNEAHQAVKFPPEDREWVVAFIEKAEYDHYGLPQPDLNILLIADVHSSQRLLTQRQGESRDAHEAKALYQREVQGFFLHLA